jgi:hypothetical protein
MEQVDVDRVSPEEREEFNDCGYGSDDDDDDVDLLFLNDTSKHDEPRSLEREMRAADRLSFRLLAVEDNEEEENRLLRQSLRLASSFERDRGSDNEDDHVLEVNDDDDNMSGRARFNDESKARNRVWTMIIWAAAGFVLVVTGIVLVGQVVGPPNQPVGSYTLVEYQSGEEFFQYYSFYEGADSAGSNGYNQYVNRDHASVIGIVNVTLEIDKVFDDSTRPFIYIGTAATSDGPRDSIRLEGTRRFNRGLFMYVLFVA